MNKQEQRAGLKTGLEKALTLLSILSSGEKLGVLAPCDASCTRAALPWQLRLPAAKAILHQLRLSRFKAPAADQWQISWSQCICLYSH